jgi:plasmid maintenance system killer protein
VRTNIFLSQAVNAGCGVCFEWWDGDAYNVEIVDYH